MSVKLSVTRLGSDALCQGADHHFWNITTLIQNGTLSITIAQKG
jgi:hypothetical protein